MNSLAAAEAGVGAGVVDYLPELGVLVIDFIDGRTYENATFAEPGVIERVAHACRKLHGGPRFTGDFDMFRRQAALPRGPSRSAATACSTGTTPSTARSAGCRPRWPRARSRPCRATTTCSPGTSSTTGSKLWLIDYEYSGNNDAVLRARQHRHRVRARPRPGRGAGHGVLRARAARPDRPRPSAVAGVAVRLGALGLHPGRGQQHRLRLRRVGPGALREGRAHVHRSRTSSGCWRRCAVTTERRRRTCPTAPGW